MEPKPYSEPCQTPKIECFVQIVNSFQSLTIFAKSSILDIWLGSEYVAALQGLGLSLSLSIIQFWLRLIPCFFAAHSPAGNHMFKVNNRNTRKRCEICSKLTIKTPEQRQWRRSGVFIVNFEHISHLALVFLLLTLSR